MLFSNNPLPQPSIRSAVLWLEMLQTTMIFQNLKITIVLFQKMISSEIQACEMRYQDGIPQMTSLSPKP